MKIYPIRVILKHDSLRSNPYPSHLPVGDKPLEPLQPPSLFKYEFGL